ncbi:NACHT, LRR and PYD domains-containing protein 2 [Nannospalax galili]|uniref:NACHT, LRR and PYD domains-containing protein 2 n=1 Tax=Nannospalax galili TaxID=1026970 RepID=UPI0004ED4FA1|nr:NACHT, LRR and PYD domains-containing protein 2 [Nannospalax galili]
MAYSDPLDFNLKGLLEMLDEEELDQFKCVLMAYTLPDELQQIPQLTMKLADARQLAEILTDYCPSGWVERVTIQILEEMNRIDLSQLVEREIQETASRKEWPELVRQGNRRLWRRRLQNLWRNNFWPGGSSKVYIDTEMYRTLLGLCNPKKAERPFARTLVLQGLAGTGKTTLVKKLMLEWTKGRQGQIFDCAFYISCREINHIESGTLVGLLCEDVFDCEKCISLPLAQAQEVLFVVDGLDELRAPRGGLICDISGDWDAEVSGVILVSSLIKRKLVPHATLLVTTHPDTLHVLRHMVEQPLFLEVKGFSEQEKQEYFLRHFRDEQRALRALDAMRCSSALFDLASAPAVCWVVCTCLERQMEKGEDLALTCQTCTSLFLKFLCNQFPPASNRDHPRRNLQEALKNLCRLAQYGLTKDLTIFHEDDLERTGLKDSDLRPFLDKCILQKDWSCKNCYFFIHPSMLFLMAAMFYILKDSENEDNPVWSISDLEVLFSKECRIDNPNMTQVWLYLFGLFNKTRTQELETTFGCQTSMKVKQELLQYKSEENKPLFFLLDLKEVFSCLYESQEEEFVKEVMALFEEMSLCLKTNTDLMHSSFCLKSCERLQRVSLQVAKGIFPDKDTASESKAQDKRPQKDKRLLLSWTDLCSMFGSNKNLIFLDISQSFFNNSSLKTLCGRLACTPFHFQKVVLKNISPAKAYQSFCLTFTGYETLTHLTLQDSNLSDTLPSLCKVVKHQACNLQYLRLGSCSPSFQRWDDFFMALQSNKSLTCLDLTDNELLDKGAKLLCRTLRQPKCLLQRVSLENCQLTEACCKEFSSTLMVSQKLTHLSLAKNNLGNGGVKILCEGLSYPECKLQTLVLWSCNIASDGCNHISKLLQQAPSLTQLDLGLNRLGISGVQFLCGALKEPLCNLKSLWLWGCSITPISCKDFSAALSSNKSLTTLDLGQNSLGSDAVKILYDTLKSQTCPLQTFRFRFDGEDPDNKKLLKEIAESNPQLTIESDHSDPKKKKISSPYFIF